MRHLLLRVTLLLLKVVHNMSSDSSSIASIRHEQALPMLIHLLKVLPRVLPDVTSEFHIMLCFARCLCR